MEFNNLSKQPSNKYLGVVVNFESQKEQISGDGHGWRYKVAIMDSYTDTIDVSDENIEYAIALLPTTAGSGGASVSKSCRISQGDVVVLEKISGISFIVGVFGRNNETVYGTGRFDAKSGFFGRQQPKNVLGRQEVSERFGHFTPRPLPKGSGSDKSVKRKFAGT
tara:strand:- start:112 stop:606 length:495 start_codon:yes stop_codon:yes gene_type:complete